jgi:ComEC/Rec2-related protein
VQERFFFFSSSFCFGLFLHVRFPLFSETFWILLGILLGVFLWRGFKKDLPAFFLLCLLLITGGYVRTANVIQSHLNSPPKFKNNERYAMQLYARKNKLLEIEVLPLSIGAPSFTLLSRQALPSAMEDGAVLSGVLRNLKMFPELSEWQIKAEVTELKPAKSHEISPAGRLRIFLNTVRIWLRKKLETMFSYYPRLNTFLQTALIQQKTTAGRELAENFRMLGLLHVFCVSGFHISVLSGIFIFLLKLLKTPKTLRCLLTGFLILSYGLITGFSPSVLRAVSCGLLVMAGTSLNREVKSIRILCFVLLIHAALFPLDALRPGFHLTYGLCLILLRWSYLTSGPRNLLLLGLIMQLYLLPYALYKFGQYPVFSIVGLFFSPLLAILLVYGFIALGAGLFFTAPILLLNRLAGPLGEGFLYLLVELSEKLHFFWENNFLSLPRVCAVYTLLAIPFLRPKSTDRQNNEQIKKFEDHCNGFDWQNMTNPGLELLRLLEKITEKKQLSEHETQDLSEIILNFTEHWQKKGNEKFLPFIRFGLMAEYIVLQIREKIFSPLQQKIINEKLVFDLSSVTNPSVRLFLKGQKSYHNLNVSRQILKFLNLHINSGLIESLCEPHAEMEPFWLQVFITLEKSSWFEQQNLFQNASRTECYAKFSEIRELLSGLSLA